MRIPTNWLCAYLIWISAAAAPVAVAQTLDAGGVDGSVSQHHRSLYKAMAEMTQEMERITAAMSVADSLSEMERKSLTRKLELMARVMNRMAGLAARPAMREPEWRRQMERMEREMRQVGAPQGLKLQ